jgi:hypothetical protein
LTLISGVMPRRRFLPGLRPYGGSSYWCLSGDAVSFVHRYVADHPEFVSFFRRVFIPDELFFQTILVNSELKNQIVNDDLRYMRWTASGPGRKCSASTTSTACATPTTCSRASSTRASTAGSSS